MLFVADEPALVIGKYLVVSDLHIGIESEYRKAGFSLEPHAESMAERINSIASDYGCSKVVLNGDTKHSIFGGRTVELVGKFLSMLEPEPVLVRGNHDAGLDRIAHMKSQLRIGSIVVAHGHARIRGEWETAVIGHNHPCVEIKDRLGSTYRMPAWVDGTAKGKRVIIMPAFSRLAGCHPVSAGFQGPVASGINEYRLFLLDGTEL